MKIAVSSSENLADILHAKGVALDMRCGGLGRCGRCRVTLVSGSWACDGVPVSIPATVSACRTRLIGGRGLVEVAGIEISAPKHMPGFDLSMLPKTPETVIAFDIGTTTLAAVKICDGKILASTGAFNAQNRFGDNVVTRIAHAATAEGSAELQEAILSSLKQLLDELGADGVKRIAVSGNTVMCCLLHGIDPTSIGVYPFAPTVSEFPARRDLLPPFEVLTLPCISGYLGGDIVAGLYATDLRAGEMLVDLGTNCEIVFNTGNGWFGTSAAAGPAFEGVGLRCGMRAGNGAIDHYRGPHNYSVIGDTGARGICGSAYVDYLAVERAGGRINEFGRFVSPLEAYREITSGVGLSEEDVEQLLKAKAAISSGISALEEYCGATAAKLFLAGGFAAGLALDRAIAIGMLPPDRKMVKIGNSSLAGAAALAVRPELFSEFLRLSRIPKEIPSAELPGFSSRFADALLLP